MSTTLSFSITLEDPDQISGLDRVVQAANAKIATANAALPEGATPAPLLTQETYLSARLNEILTSYGQQAARERGLALLDRALRLPWQTRIPLMTQVEQALA
jgi:hypothetical protein